MSVRKQQRKAKYINPVPSTEESARKAELLARLLDYSTAHAVSDMSLRPLAAAIGTSPRMLLYFFGSKQGLIREVLAAFRRNQLELVEKWLHDRSPSGDPLARLWEWLTDPKQAGVERLFFESYGRSIHGDDGAWAGFARDSVADWLPVVARMLHSARPTGRAEHPAATFVLATLRGLLLDLLATGDAARVDSAFELLQRMRQDREPATSPGMPRSPAPAEPRRE